MRNLSIRLCHLALTLLLLCTGTQTARATWADDEFGNNGNFNAYVKNNNCLHFYLIYSADKGFDCWVNRNAYIKVDRYNKNQSYIGTEEIFRYDGWQESSQIRLNLKKGAILFTNNTSKKVSSVLETHNLDWVGETGKTGDKWVVELDWYPPQEWQKDGELLDVKIQVDYKDNQDGNKTRYIDRLNKFNLNGTVPTFNTEAPVFMGNNEHSAKGEVWSSKYTLSTAYNTLICSENLIQDATTSTSGTLYCTASDKARTVKYDMTFARNADFKNKENRFWLHERTVQLPAYHSIHNFGYNKQSNQLRWELYTANEGDKVIDDAFYIESSTVPNFADAKKLAEFSFKVGTSSAASHSRMDGSKQVFEYTLPEGHNGSYFRIRRKSAEKLGWNQEFASSSSSANFISDLCVSVANNSTDARNALLRQGYKLMDFNLNHGVKGAYVYLGYKETDNPLAAISRIAIKRGAEWAADKGAGYTDGGYKMLAVPTLGEGAGNLTQGIEGGQQMYLYYSKDNVKGKGKSLVTRVMHTGEKSTLASGYRYVVENLTADASNPSNAVNLNQSTKAVKEEIRLVCQMHEHVSDFKCRKEGDGVFAGHDCCGVYRDNVFKDNAYYIYNEGDLSLLRELTLSGYSQFKAELMADIILNKDVLIDGELNEKAKNTFVKWEPISNEEHHYSGTFDGHGHCISGVYLPGNNFDASVFGSLKGATIKNLIIKDAYIYAYSYLGGFANRVFNGSKDPTIIDNCMFQGFLDMSDGGIDVGGIVGYTNETKLHISNCHTMGRIRVEKARSIGGIIGYEPYDGPTMSYCFSEMSCNETKYRGLSPYLFRFTVKGCYCTSGGDNINGLIGEGWMASGRLAYELNAGGIGCWGQLLPDDQKPFLLITDTVKAKKPVMVYRQMGRKCTNHDEIVATGIYSNHLQKEYDLFHTGKVHHADKAPTCTEKGNLEYWDCSDCKGIFGNDACTIQLKQVPEIEEIGHHDYDVFDVCNYCKRTRLDIETDEADGITAAPCHSHSVEEYDLSGRRIKGSQRGIVILKDAHGNVRKMIKR